MPYKSWAELGLEFLHRERFARLAISSCMCGAFSRASVERFVWPFHIPGSQSGFSRIRQLLEFLVLVGGSAGESVL